MYHEKWTLSTRRMEVNIKMYEKNTLMERIMEILERLDVRELRLVYFFAEGLARGKKEPPAGGLPRATPSQ